MMVSKIKVFFVSLALSLSWSSCQQTIQKEYITIAVTRERPNEHQYGSWLKATDSSVRIINLSPLTEEEMLDTLVHCHGLLLSGGADIHPSRYGKPNDTARCGFIDLRRDAYEQMVYSKAGEMQLPVLGICRGLQFVNVAEGGSLFVDLPTDKSTADLHRKGQEDWSYHPVFVKPNSLLDFGLQQEQLTVASNHHQGIDRLAPTLMPLAYTSDSLIEAITWISPNDKAFLLAVQWHPEWVSYDDPFSTHIAASFINAARAFKTQQAKKGE